MTLLHLAASNGHEGVVWKLIELGADKEAKERGDFFMRVRTASARARSAKASDCGARS
jgi:hypothetical protein